MGQRYDFSIATVLGNIDTPSLASDAATKAYVDSRPVSTGTVTTVTSLVSGFNFGVNPTVTPALTIQNASAPTTQFLRGDGQWQTAVTSVGLTSSATPLTVGGATITGSGSFTLSWGTGQIPVVNLGSGTGSSTNFLRGDGQWAVPPVGTGTVTTVSSAVTGFNFGANPTVTPALTIQNASAPTTQFLRGDGQWQTAVTSVGLTSSATPLTISGATITGAGSFTLTWGTGQIPVANLGSGTGSSANFLRGDGQWASVPAGTGTVTTVTSAVGGFNFGANPTVTPALTIQNASSPLTQFLRGDGSWQTAVTSVDMSVPAGFAIGGRPITGSGTFALSYSGQIPTTSLGTGTPTNANFLRGDGSWAALPGGGSVTVVTSNVGGFNFGVNSTTTPALTIQNASSPTTQFLRGDGNWNTAVTSVGMSVPTGFAISGPVTTSGTLALTYSGLIPPTSLGNGTPNPSTFLRGDQAWIPIVTAAGVNGQATTTGILNFVNGTNTTFTRTGNNFAVNVAGIGTGTVTQVTSGLTAFNFGANQTTTPLLTIVGGSTSTFLRGDGTWVTPPSSGGTVTQVTSAVSGFTYTNQTSTPALTIQNASSPTTQYLRGDGTWVTPPASGGTVTSVTTNITGFVFSNSPTSPQLSIQNASSPTTQFLRGDGQWQTAVTSIGLTSSATPLTISGGTVTGSGSFTLSWGTGQIPVANLGSGTGSNTNFLRGDGQWAVPPTSGGTVTSVSSSIGAFSFGGSPTVSPSLTITNAASPSTQFLRGDGIWSTPAGESNPGVWFSGVGAPTSVSGAILGNYYWNTSSLSSYLLTAVAGTTQTWTAQPNLDSYVRTNADGEISILIGSTPIPPYASLTNTGGQVNGFVEVTRRLLVTPLNQSVVNALLALGNGIVQNTLGDWTLPSAPILISLTQNPTATQYSSITTITQTPTNLQIFIQSNNLSYFNNATYPSNLYIALQRFTFQPQPLTAIDDEVRRIRLISTVTSSYLLNNYLVSGDTTPFTSQRIVSGDNIRLDTDAQGNPRINADIPLILGRGWIISVDWDSQDIPVSPAWSGNDSIPRFTLNGQVVLASGINAQAYWGATRTWVSGDTVPQDTQYIINLYQQWNNSFSDALQITNVQVEDASGRFRITTAAPQADPTQTDDAVKALFNVNNSNTFDHMTGIQYDDASGTYIYQRAQRSQIDLDPPLQVVLNAGNSANNSTGNTGSIVLTDTTVTPNTNSTYSGSGTITPQLKLSGSTSGVVTLAVPATVTSNYTLTYPAAQSNNDNNIIGVNSTGALSYTLPTIALQQPAQPWSQSGFSLAVLATQGSTTIFVLGDATGATGFPANSFLSFSSLGSPYYVISSSIYDGTTSTQINLQSPLLGSFSGGSALFRTVTSTAQRFTAIQLGGGFNFSTVNNVLYMSSTGGSGTTPSLDQVTAVGAVSTRSITIQASGANGLSIALPTQVGPAATLLAVGPGADVDVNISPKGDGNVIIGNQVERSLKFSNPGLSTYVRLEVLPPAGTQTGNLQLLPALGGTVALGNLNSEVAASIEVSPVGGPTANRVYMNARSGWTTVANPTDIVMVPKFGGGFYPIGDDLTQLGATNRGIWLASSAGSTTLSRGSVGQVAISNGTGNPYWGPALPYVAYTNDSSTGQTIPQATYTAVEIWLLKTGTLASLNLSYNSGTGFFQNTANFSQTFMVSGSLYVSQTTNSSRIVGLFNGGPAIDTNTVLKIPTSATSGFTTIVIPPTPVTLTASGSGDMSRFCVAVYISTGSDAVIGGAVFGINSSLTIAKV